MSTFYEYQQARFIAQSNEISLEEAFILRENMIMQFAQTFAKKYMLPVAVVAAIISGQGCGSNQCPPKQVQDQVKVDFDKSVYKGPTDAPESPYVPGVSGGLTSTSAFKGNTGAPEAKFVPGVSGNSDGKTVKSSYRGPTGY